MSPCSIRGSYTDVVKQSPALTTASPVAGYLNSLTDQTTIKLQLLFITMNLFSPRQFPKLLDKKVRSSDTVHLIS